MSAESHDKHECNTATVCRDCPAEYECGKLSMAITMLSERRKHESNPVIVTRITEFLKKIDSTGYNYSDAAKLCSLSEQREVVRDLTSEAIKILAETSS